MPSESSEIIEIVAIALGVLVILTAVVAVLFPRAVFYVQFGWLFDDLEPSGCLLFIYRLTGIAILTLILVGYFYLL